MTAAAPEFQALLTVPQVAKLLQLSERQIFRLIDAGELATVRIGRSLRIQRSALEEFIQNNRVEATRHD
jgi:excisionase family DNA binding protein